MSIGEISVGRVRLASMLRGIALEVEANESAENIIELIKGAADAAREIKYEEESPDISG